MKPSADVLPETLWLLRLHMTELGCLFYDR
jgi:hypothetical protein